MGGLLAQDVRLKACLGGGVIESRLTGLRGMVGAVGEGRGAGPRSRALNTSVFSYALANMLGPICGALPSLPLQTA